MNHLENRPTSSDAPDTGSQQHSSSPSSKAESIDASLDDSQLSIQSVDRVPDSERHPKGRRKRTAAKDKAILEAAYHANPKPDKAARLDLVKRVSLNEKEVQIWFQNRRQNDRRKSRPLSPQEIAALKYGGMQIISSDPVPYDPAGPPLPGTISPAHSSSPPPGDHTSPFLSESGPSSGDEAGKPHSSPIFGASQGQEVPQPVDVIPSSQGSEPLSLSQGAEPRDDSSRQLSRSFSSSLGYLSNRWNAGSSFSTPLGSREHDGSFRADAFLSSSCPPSTTGTPILPPPNSSQSSFRLSLSLEGKAEVVSSTLSPPHLPPPRPTETDLSSLPPVRRPSLHRSQSASNLPSSVTLPPMSALLAGAAPLPPRPTAASVAPPHHHHHHHQQHRVGRSRDVHAWELACDATETHEDDELIAQAKNESRGSAIAAISLLRSTSSSGGVSGGASSPVALQAGTSAATGTPTGAKRSAAGGHGGPQQQQQQRQHHPAKKAKLGRALSSVGRLQTSFGTERRGAANVDNLVKRAQTPPVAVGDKDKDADLHGGGAKAVKVSMLVSPSGNDSDKENWSPDREGNPQPRFHAHAPHHHPALPPSAAAGRKPLPSAGGNAVAAATAGGHPRRTGGRILQEHRPSLFAAGGRANTAPPPSSGGHYRRAGGGGGGKGDAQVDIFEDGGGSPAAAAMHDDEVERFMRGEVSPSKKGDVDAVAGLLSLSQGNWR